MNTLSFEPLIPPALWLTLAVAGLVLLVWYGWGRPGSVPRRRWAGILSLMAMGLVLVLVILLNPTWVEPIAPPAGKPVLTVLVDATASMSTTDAADGRSRYQAAVQFARSAVQELSDRYEVRLAIFAGHPAPAEIEALAAMQPEGTVTDLAAALTGSLEENRSQGQTMILMSDGIHNAGGGTARVLDAVRVAKALACPVYTHTLGGDAVVKDVAVELRSPQELAFIGQKVTVNVLVRQRGYTGQQATLVLSHAGQELESRQVPLPAQESTEIRFQVGQDKPGVYHYEVRVDPLPGEVSRSNNTASLLLRVVDKPVRVLVLEGKPYWDGKFLVRTLLTDPSLELDSVIRMGENRLLRRTWPRDGKAVLPGKMPVAPREEWQVLTDFAKPLAEGDTLRSYQVVVLGRDADGFLTEPVLASLRQWLARDGGCLVCYRGQPTSQVNQRLGQLLPVRWSPARESRFRVQLTERGRDLRWFPQVGLEPAGEALTRLPTLATAARAEQPKPLAVVLATAQTQPTDVPEPVVVYQPYGSGRVVVIEGSGMWRWAFLPPREQQHDEVYRSLWHSLLRWLASSADLLPGQKLALRSDKVSFGTTEPATATLLMREEAAQGLVPRIELRGDGLEKPRTVTPVPLGEEPGTFRIVFGQLPEGRYQAQVVGSSESESAARAAFDVRSLIEEQLDLKARPDLMARIAQESGGAVLTGSRPRELLDQFQELREQSRPQRVQRLTAWDQWWVLLAVFGVWGTAWALRRSGGLV